MSKQLEYVGIKLPGQGRRIAQIAIGPYEKEEQVFGRISKILGAEFRLAGVTYVVTSSDPFKIAQVTPEGQVPFKRRIQEDSECDVDVSDSVEASDYSHVETIESNNVDVPAQPVTLQPVEVPPAVVRPVVVQTSPAVVVGGPQVGERWRPKDPRRKNSFTILKIEGDTAHTDDGRTVKLDRFRRYERI